MTTNECRRFMKKRQRRVSSGKKRVPVVTSRMEAWVTKLGPKHA